MSTSATVAADPDASSSIEVHEIVTFQFKAEVAYDEQVDTMRRLDGFVAKLPGFRVREYFYSAADNRWVDHIAWADESAARAAMQIMSNPDAAVLFGRMEPSTVALSHYHRVPPA